MSSLQCSDALCWKDLQIISEQHGDSFYFADVKRFASNVVRFLKAFRSYYSKTSIAYSYKTNYLPAFIRCADNLGTFSEVVSRYEYDFSRGLGIDSRKIIFNGPIKSSKDLQFVLEQGSRVQLDSLFEVELLLKIQFSKPVSVGLRCHLGENTPGSRFGIVLDSPEGKEAVRALQSVHFLQISSLHAHHSANRSTSVYQDRALSLIEIHEDILGGQPLDLIDLGGGFASEMDPKLVKQMKYAPPSYEQYAEAVGTIFSKKYGETGPGLLLEPGIGILSDALAFATRVQVLKELRGAKFAVLDGSVFNIKPLRHSINLPVEIFERPNAERFEGNWDFVGHTCMERAVDLLHQEYVSSIAVGDFVVFKNIGAYTTVLNAPFIRGTPPVLECVDGRLGRLLRRGSTASDLLESYRES
ncbi:Diaminopimelate decarboxylase [Gammaproteobacteria bacterium]